MPGALLGSGSAEIVNQTAEFDYLGSAVATTSATAHTKGAASAALGVVPRDWCETYVTIHAAGSASNRYLVDILANGVVVIPNLYAHPGLSTAVRPATYRLLRQLPAGATITAAAQTSGAGGGGSNINVAIGGKAASALLPPGYNTCEALNVDVANTLASATAQLSDNAWVELINSAAQAYKALNFSLGWDGVNAPTAQTLLAQIGTGLAAAEVVKAWHYLGATAGAPQIYSAVSAPFELDIPAGARIVGRCLGLSATTSNVRTAVYGCRNA